MAHHQREANLSQAIRRSTASLTLLLSIMTLYPTTVFAQTPGASRAPSTAAAPNPTEDSYTLGAGDRISITTFRVPQYSGEFEVLVNGTVNLPLVGAVSVDGMTLEQASTAISSAFSRYLRRPIVTVSLLARRPLQIGIAGEVNRPGSYTIPAETSQLPTITRLLQTAGGITQAANVREVQIRRLRRGAPPQLITVNLWELLRTGNLSYDVSLRDGDSIFIPETAANLAEAPLISSSSFAPDSARPINIAIVGEINRPGTYTISGSTTSTAEAGATRSNVGTPATVTRAIQIAGGIKPMADIRQVQVRRSTRSGTIQTLQLNLWDLLEKGDLRQDAILQEGDTIVVPTAVALSPAEAIAQGSATFSPSSIRVNVVGEVTKSGVVELAPNAPMNQAILAAGGFNTRARRGEVELVRLNPDGTVARRRIPVDFAQGIDGASNPTLQNNDVIIVNRSGLARFSDDVGNITRPLGGILSIFRFPFSFFNLFD